MQEEEEKIFEGEKELFLWEIRRRVMGFVFSIGKVNRGWLVDLTSAPWAHCNCQGIWPSSEVWPISPIFS